MKSIKFYMLSLLGLMFSRFYAVTSVNAGSTLSAMGASALQRTMWDQTLNEPDATLDDIWNQELTNVVKIHDGEIKVPESVFFQVPTDPSNPHTVRVMATQDLREAPQEGNAEHMPSNEEQLRALWGNLRYNEIKKAVAMRGWGIDYEDIKWTGLYNTNPKFKKFYAEYRGLRIRKASMLSVEDALTKAPVSLTQQFCSNIFIPNLYESDMPVYDVSDLTVTAGSVDSLGYYPDKVYSGADTFVESIADKMLDASGTTSSPQAYMGMADLDRLDTWLTMYVKMPKTKIGDDYGYLFVCPQLVYDYLSSLTRTDGFGGYIQDTYQTNSKGAYYWGKVIRYKSLFIVRDSRGPTLTVSGSEGSYTLQPGFVNPGNNDDRNLTAWNAVSGSLNYPFDVGFVYGGGGVAERVVAPTKYVKEIQDYGYNRGRGSYLLGGIQTMKWDVDSPDDANDSNGTGSGKTLVQKSVAMVLCSRVPVAALRSIT